MYFTDQWPRNFRIPRDESTNREGYCWGDCLPKDSLTNSLSRTSHVGDSMDQVWTACYWPRNSSRSYWSTWCWCACLQECVLWNVRNKTQTENLLKSISILFPDECQQLLRHLYCFQRRCVSEVLHVVIRSIIAWHSGYNEFESRSVTVEPGCPFTLPSVEFWANIDTDEGSFFSY